MMKLNLRNKIKNWKINLTFLFSIIFSSFYEGQVSLLKINLFKLSKIIIIIKNSYLKFKF